MAVPTLYQTPASPPVRAVLMTAKAIDLKLNEKFVDLMNKEHLTPEYLKLNPQHTVPVLVDTDGTTICDSHAIVTYLVSKYGKDDSLYPKNLAKKALIDQRLYFNASEFFPVLKSVVKPRLAEPRPLEKDEINRMQEPYEVIEKFLENHQWVAGDSVTVADFCLLSTAATMNKIVAIDSKKFPKLADWLKRGEKLPAYSVTVSGLQKFGEMYGKLFS